MHITVLRRIIAERWAAVPRTILLLFLKSEGSKDTAITPRDHAPNIEFRPSELPVLIQRKNRQDLKPRQRREIELGEIIQSWEASLRNSIAK